MHGAPETVMTLLNDQCEALAYAHNMLWSRKESTYMQDH